LLLNKEFKFISMNIRRRLNNKSTLVTALLLLSNTQAQSIMDVLKIQKESNGCAGAGELFTRHNGDLLCAPSFASCSQISGFDRDTLCNCCSTVNGLYSEEKCLPERFCNLPSLPVGEQCSMNIEC
jgi:hypothetical protein